MPRLDFFFFFNDPAPTEIYTLSLHDALPIYPVRSPQIRVLVQMKEAMLSEWLWLYVDNRRARRSEEHTSELQSLAYLVCRLLLEKKKKNNKCLRLPIRRLCGSGGQCLDPRLC